MKSQHPKDRLSTSRRNFIKAGVVTGGIIINLNWPSILAAQPIIHLVVQLVSLDRFGVLKHVACLRTLPAWKSRVR